MKLITKRLVIRDLIKEDAKSIVENANDLQVSQYLALVPHPYKTRDARWFINSCKKEAKKKPRENYELGIALKNEGKIIGVIGLTHVDKYSKKAYLGFWLGKRYWKQGVMSEAASAMIEFAFNRLNLLRLDTSASTKNKASNSLIRKLGFSPEGTRKEFLRAKSTGEVHDEKIYGLLERNYPFTINEKLK